MRARVHTGGVEQHEEMVAGVRRVFDLVAADYDNVGVSFFQPIAAGLVSAVGAAPGHRALDVGCGNGVSSRALAAAVAPTGSLVGLDLSPAMVEKARSSLVGGPVDAAFLVGDARDPALPQRSFDVVVASLVVFFLPDPAAAVSRWVRLVAPGGRIGLSTFGRSSPAWQALEGQLREFMPAMDPRMMGPQSPFASDGGMASLLAAGGAHEVYSSSHRMEFAFESFEQWLTFSRSVGQRAAWERMTEEDRLRVLERTREIYDEESEPGGGLPAWQEVRYTVGSVL